MTDTIQTEEEERIAGLEAEVKEAEAKLAAAKHAVNHQEYPKMLTGKAANGRTVALKYKSDHEKAGKLVIVNSKEEEDTFDTAHAEPDESVAA